MIHPIQPPSAIPRKTRARGRWLAGLALAVAFVAGGVTLPPLAAAAEDSAMQGMMGGSGHSGMHAMAMAHLTRMLDAAGASAEQQTQITAILHAGFQPMASLHTDMRQTHERLHALLLAPTIDRAALEQLRASQIAQIDQASRTLVKAMADAAEVLRPDQRAKLASMALAPHAPS